MAERFVDSVVSNSTYSGLMEAYGTQFTTDPATHQPVALAPPRFFPGQSLASRLEETQRFMRPALDYRRTGDKKVLIERADAETEILREGQVRAVHAASESSGMTGEVFARYGHYGVLCVLGGGSIVPERRITHLMRTIDGSRSGTPVSGEAIVLMGSSNPQDPERVDKFIATIRRRVDVDASAIRRLLGTEQVREFDLMAVAGELLLNGERLGDERGNVGSTEHTEWRIRRMASRDPGTPPIYAVSAPSSEPWRRANTAATYNFLRNVPELGIHHGPSVLVVTDQYFSFQGADAMASLTLPFGCDVDVVGRPELDMQDPSVDLSKPGAQWERDFEGFVRGYNAEAAAMRAGIDVGKGAFVPFVTSRAQEVLSLVNSTAGLHRELSHYRAMDMGLTG